MKQDALRAKLIDGTIHVIAQDGLDKASTKRIGLATSVNEAYIYRLFEDKEDMFAKAFDVLDEELMNKLIQNLSIFDLTDLEFEERFRIFFYEIWSFLLQHRERCYAYVRYYYSPYFAKYSAESHKQRFAPFVKEFSKPFIQEANVWMILNHILNVILDFALKVHNNQMPPDDNYSEHVFRVIYCSIDQYLVKEEVH